MRRECQPSTYSRTAFVFAISRGSARYGHVSGQLPNLRICGFHREFPMSSLPGVGGVEISIQRHEGCLGPPGARVCSGNHLFPVLPVIGRFGSALFSSGKTVQAAKSPSAANESRADRDDTSSERFLLVTMTWSTSSRGGWEKKSRRWSSV